MFIKIHLSSKGNLLNETGRLVDGLAVVVVHIEVNFVSGDGSTVVLEGTKSVPLSIGEEFDGTGSTDTSGGSAGEFVVVVEVRMVFVVLPKRIVTIGTKTGFAVVVVTVITG